VKLIAGTEALERIAFQGVRSILVIAMTGLLAYPDAWARAWYHGFLMAVALTPPLGAWVANRLLGRYRTILLVSLLGLAGLVVTALWQSPAGLATGLALVAIGAGGPRPCFPAFADDQLGPGDHPPAARTSAWFRWTINLGAAAAMVAAPWLFHHRGPLQAFAVPFLCAAAGLLLFVAGTPRFVRAPVAPVDRDGLLRVVWHALKRLGTHRAGEHWIEPARARHPAAAVEGARAVLQQGGVFAAATVFWALFDQTGSSWVLQGRQLVTRLDLGMPRPASVEIDPAQLLALGPLLVLLLLPLLDAVILPALKRRGQPVSTTGLLAAGLLLAAAAFVAAALVQHLADGGRPPHLLWQLPQYLLLSAGEVLVAVTGLELASTRVPRASRATVVSIWYFTAFLGNLLTFLATLAGLAGAAAFWFFAGLMLVAALAFALAAGRWRPPSPQAGAGRAAAS
jgi:POT family proton-dependent oligopeptide transporter